MAADARTGGNRRLCCRAGCRAGPGGEILDRKFLADHAWHGGRAIGGGAVSVDRGSLWPSQDAKPRHGKVDRNLGPERDRIQCARIAAFKDFKADVTAVAYRAPDMSRRTRMTRRRHSSRPLWAEPPARRDCAVAALGRPACSTSAHVAPKQASPRCDDVVSIRQQQSKGGRRV